MTKIMKKKTGCNIFYETLLCGNLTKDKTIVCSFFTLKLPQQPLGPAPPAQPPPLPTQYHKPTNKLPSASPP